MSKVQLVIGNRNYSSWSLRPWLCLRKSGVAFDEILLPLDTPEFAERIGEYSPTGRVPVLWDDGQCIWDSLAICEYINDRFAAGKLWPADISFRGLGRAMAAEMHSGLNILRNELPMNLRASGRYVPMSPALQKDLDRVFALWSDCLTCHGDKGPWLLGQFSIVDAMFAPVVLRLGTYGIEVPADLQSFTAQLLADPDIAHWRELAAEESWIVDADEAGIDRSGG